MMHRLQKHILSLLIRSHALKYAQLKPAEVEGNLFMYHLRQLMKQGLVCKQGDGRYELSSSGKQYADALSLETFQPRSQPRIVTLIAVQNDKQEWLMLKRKKQPLLGQIGFPYGKIHVGESIKEAATRELQEKTGLVGELHHRGDGYITIFQNSEAVSHIMFHLFYGINPQGELVPHSEAGEVFWACADEISENDLMPSVPDLIKKLKSDNERFFTELEYR